MEKYSIRQLVESDWRDYRAIRLEALVKHPDCFCPSRDETKFHENDWKERLRNPNGAVFGLYSGANIIGLTGIVREKNEAGATRAHLVSSYIQVAHRRNGLSKLFFESRINWAQKQGNIRTLVLERRDDNVLSQRAHQKYEFKLAGSHDQVWPDGSRKPSLTFEMAI